MAFKKYAKDYDIFYRHKSYKKECLYLKRLFNKFSKSHPQSILDLGCGTGNYLIPLSKMGYKLSGVDASKDMLSLAKKKLNKSHIKAQLYKGRLQSFKLKGEFDVIICMFSVINYVTKKREIIKTLKHVYKHLKPGGIFVFDFWQKEAVEKNYSKVKRNVFRGTKYQVERSSTTKIFPKSQLCEVRYHCDVKRKGKLVDQYQEKHTLQYFSIVQMKQYLKKAGFKVLDAHPFLKPRASVKKLDWDVTIIAKK